MRSSSSLIGFTTAALAFASPAFAVCPAGLTAPICETGHFEFHHGNVSACFAVINTDTGDKYGIQYSTLPGGVPGADMLAPVLTEGGPLTVISSGQFTSCGDGVIYQITAVRNVLY